MSQQNTMRVLRSKSEDRSPFSYFQVVLLSLVGQTDHKMITYTQIISRQKHRKSVLPLGRDIVTLAVAAAAAVAGKRNERW